MDPESLAKKRAQKLIASIFQKSTEGLLLDVKYAETIMKVVCSLANLSTISSDSELFLTHDDEVPKLSEWLGIQLRCNSLHLSTPEKREEFASLMESCPCGLLIGSALQEKTMFEFSFKNVYASTNR